MLAIQLPSMGSSKPPKIDMPFGYAFDSNPTFPFPSPTAPAPGPPLLDDSESNLLDSFFDGVSSDHYNYDFFSNTPEAGELAGGWEELPPAFMGTRVTFNQPPQLPDQISSMNFAEANNPMHFSLSQPPLSPSTTSADVLAAATVLQNGSNPSSHNMSSETLFGNHGLSSQPANHPIRPHAMSHYPPPTSGLDRSRDGFMRDTLYTEMMFGPNHAAPDVMRRPKPVPHKVDIRWGSDAGFGSPQGFVPPSNAAKVEEAESKRLQALDEFIGAALGAETSAENTRPSSPTMQRNVPTQRRPSTGIFKEEETDPSRKRRKGKLSLAEDGGDDDDDESQAKVDGRKKRKSVVKVSASSPGSSEGGHKRRKSCSATAKTTRENLTEDQKRENHIKSEQKRRTLIREGFEDLGELVPGLRGGGFSKSAILVMTADWLEQLMQGNEGLRQRINAAKGR